MGEVNAIREQMAIEQEYAEIARNERSYGIPGRTRAALATEVALELAQWVPGDIVLPKVVVMWLRDHGVDRWEEQP